MRLLNFRKKQEVRPQRECGNTRHGFAAATPHDSALLNRVLREPALTQKIRGYCVDLLEADASERIDCILTDLRETPHVSPFLRLSRRN
jgi:hypothetical protein